MARWLRNGGILAAIMLAGCAGSRVPLAPPTPATLAAVQAAAPHPCNDTTAAALDAHHIPPALIRAIYYDTLITGGEKDILQGYDAWITLAGQGGYLVVRHDPDCRLRNVHTRGGASIMGVPAYRW